MAVDAELFGDALPTYFTRFIGRERECAELADLLRSPGVVTVCGVGGAGKTRLAVQVARQLRADTDLRVCWVPLATTLDSAGVVPAVAHGLGLSGIGGGHWRSAGCGTRLRTGRASAGQLRTRGGRVSDAAWSARGRLCRSAGDHHQPGAARTFLRADLRCSRLGLATDEGGEPTDAMALFVDRAAGVASGYALTELNRPVLAEICRTLQGSPLAIELAASWIRVLSPRDLLASLVLASTPWSGPIRRSSSRSGIAASRLCWTALGAGWASSDRAVIEALGVFVGGFTSEAAEAVADADLGTLSRLSQLALIQRLPDPYGGSRYQVHELVRNYALGRLELTDRVRQRHLRLFLDLVDTTGAAARYHVAPNGPIP